MYEVRFTKVFMKGALEGIRLEASSTFLSRHAAVAFIDMAREFLDIRKPCPGLLYCIEDARLVSEDATVCRTYDT